MRVKDVDRPALGAGPGRDLVQVGAGAGGQHRARMAEDLVSDQPGLAGALGRQHEDLILHARVDAAAVLRPAEADGVGGGAREEHAAPEAEPGPGAAAVVQRRQAAPPEHELDQGCVPRARPEPEPDPPAQRPDPASRLGAAAEDGPVEQHGEYDGEEQHQDDVALVDRLVEQHGAKDGED